MSPWDISALSPAVDATDGRIYALTSDTFVATSGAPVSAPAITLHATLTPGRYVLIAATEFAGSEAGFSLSIEATQPVNLLQIFPSKGPSDDAAAKTRNTGSAGAVIATSLIGLNERLASGIVGAAQKKATDKTLKMIRYQALKNARTMKLVRTSLTLAGIDSPLRMEEIVGRFFSQIFAEFSKRIGTAGAPRVVELHLDKARKFERDLRVGPVGVRYGLIRATCLHDALRRASRMQEPTRFPSAHMTSSESAAHRARDDRKALVSAITSASGSAGDMEIALLLRLNDLQVFRQAGEELRPIPGMEVLAHLPVNLSTLSRPLRDQDEENAYDKRRLAEARAIEEHFKRLMKSDSEKTAKDFEKTLQVDALLKHEALKIAESRKDGSDSE
jgi:hypothetical protein